MLSLHLVFSRTLSRYKQNYAETTDRLPRTAPGTLAKKFKKRHSRSSLGLMGHLIQSRTRCYYGLTVGWGWKLGLHPVGVGRSRPLGSPSWSGQRFRAVMVHLSCKAHAPLRLHAGELVWLEPASLPVQPAARDGGFLSLFLSVSWG